jgi:hypothetical protein
MERQKWLAKFAAAAETARGKLAEARQRQQQQQQQHDADAAEAARSAQEAKREAHAAVAREVLAYLGIFAWFFKRLCIFARHG